MVKLFKILNVNETFCAKTDTDFLKLLFFFFHSLPDYFLKQAHVILTSPYLRRVFRSDFASQSISVGRLASPT